MAKLGVAVVTLQFLAVVIRAHSLSLVPLLIFLGDSTLDVGNNKYLQTDTQCNHVPYGRIYSKSASGRWCDGKIVPDYTATALGLPPPLPFLAPDAEGENITKGINFASGGSGLLDSTAEEYNVLTFPQQLENFKKYKEKVSLLVSEDVSSLINKALFVLSIGTNDYAQNYFQSSELQQQYTTNAFQSLLLHNYETYLRALYAGGARMFTISGMPPLGCVPFIIHLLGNGSSDCVEDANLIARNFNVGLKDLLSTLKSSLRGSKFVYVDVYSAISSMINYPVLFGFSRKQVTIGCCGLGRASYGVTCNASTPICAESDKYIFFDAFHPTEHANKILTANAFVDQILSLLFGVMAAHETKLPDAQNRNRFHSLE